MELRLFKAAQGHSHLTISSPPQQTRYHPFYVLSEVIALTVLKYEVTRKSFINRMLYKYNNIVTA